MTLSEDIHFGTLNDRASGMDQATWDQSNSGGIDRDDDRSGDGDLSLNSLRRLFASDDARWRATLGRDARADGIFYYAVRTTDIYCRPICSARKPKRENASFFPSPDAAEAAGFRACKSCRPNLAGHLTSNDRCSVRPAAILFADIVGSSAMAKHLPPEETMDRLDMFHEWSSRLVRDHDGHVHKNLGDGFMAVFGNDESHADDAMRAIRCGVALADAASASASMRIGVGVHYGPVAFGIVGGDRGLFGNTVNVASRLENATRRLGAPVVVSDETIRAIRPPQPDIVSGRFAPFGKIRLPGCGAVKVWSARDVDVSR